MKKTWTLKYGNASEREMSRPFLIFLILIIFNYLNTGKGLPRILILSGIVFRICFLNWHVKRTDFLQQTISCFIC